MGLSGTDNEDHDELAVDVTFEDDLLSVEASAAAYLERQGPGERANLLASLERLDAQIAQNESFESSSRIALGFGAVPRHAFVGETNDTPIVEAVLPAVFAAQAAVVRAAKEELQSTPNGEPDALRAALDALAEARGPRTG